MEIEAERRICLKKVQKRPESLDGANATVYNEMKTGTLAVSLYEKGK
ncbi:MAG TPA: hypothetical protein H9691_07460 [Firmicutes bacterium]|nr:hypothetical protein [Bacillota bacterium]